MEFTPIEVGIGVVALLAALVIGWYVAKVAIEFVKVAIRPAIIVAALGVLGLFIVEGGNALGYWQIDTSSLNLVVPIDMVQP